MLTAAELASMRADVTASLPDTATISTPNATITKGRSTDAAPTTFTVACAIYPTRGRGGDYSGGDAMRPESRYELALPHGTVITTKATATVAGVTYAIDTVDVGTSEATCVLCGATRQGAS